MARSGFARNLRTTLQRVAVSLAVACVALPLPLAYAGQAAPCGSARVALDASIHHLVVEIGIVGINCASNSLSQEQNMACRQYTDTLTALNTCEEGHGVGDPYQRSLARAAALPLQIHKFIDAVRIGMSATEVDIAERDSFGNPVQWLKTVNTTVTASGTTQQWLYRFSRYAKATGDVYVHLHDGVVFAIQK